MKVSIILFLVLGAFMVHSKEVVLKDIKVLCDGKLYEKIEKQEINNNGNIKKETIQITGSKTEENMCPNQQTPEPNDQDKVEIGKKHLIHNLFMKHFKMARLLHSLLSSMPLDETPEVTPKHPIRRIFVFRIPLTSVAVPVCENTIQQQNTTLTQPQGETLTACDVQPVENGPETTQPSSEDQIPPPPFSANMIM